MTSEEAVAVDRREALKKLAAGGAVAAGATAVMTSTSFADGGTRKSIPAPVATPIATVTRLGSTVNCSLGIAVATCPFQTGLTPTTTARVDSAIAGVSLAGGTLAPPANTWVSPRNPLVAAVTSIPGNGNNVTIELRFDFRSVCDSRPTGATAAWRCQSFLVTITTGSGGGSGTAVSSTIAVAASPASCDTPAPSAP